LWNLEIFRQLLKGEGSCHKAPICRYDPQKEIRESSMHGRIYDNITQTIGHTPLVKINAMAPAGGAQILAKLECFNPLSSIKDRMALAMIEDAERSGLVRPGTLLIEPTSGNTGVGLAFVAAAKGYPLTIVMPETMSMERRILLRMFGAELILSPGPKGMKGAIALAKKIQSERPGSVILQQFSNPANPQIHVHTTAEEIWNDTQGKVDIVIAGVGTGGTITGVGQGLKAKKPSVQMIAVEPTESPVLSGGIAGPHKIQGIGAGFIPEILDTKIYQEIIQIPGEVALATAREVTIKEGIPAGISSGAVLRAAMIVAARPENKNKCIVAILASSTERYLSTALTEHLREELTHIKVTDIEL
jgi:cysteine synthase